MIMNDYEITHSILEMSNVLRINDFVEGLHDNPEKETDVFLQST